MSLRYLKIRKLQRVACIKQDGFSGSSLNITKLQRIALIAQVGFSGTPRGMKAGETAQYTSRAKMPNSRNSSSVFFEEKSTEQQSSHATGKRTKIRYIFPSIMSCRN